MIALHHVQLAAPSGSEHAARAFWIDGLGLTEVAKPAALQAKGGCWFRAHDGERVTAEIHVGVEDPFAPARKAHPALVVDDGGVLDTLAARLRSAGFEVDERERHSFDGYLRFHTADPFGNRVEVLAPLA
ncbi:Catechol 2,3-dioxygenase [Agrococcus baldri]|uniref:Catechol 2,3-dioxygenase n=1 Tax=Agrococcus baldri TaxID=153730 RepID=A0AA94HMR2_9MICO|nr:VOC family protein [Agrococcus baldri]SFS12061.1 Catechol 2,3-dioxygenase [Agrococcus baldri]